jgi:uncharacterized membrane protein
MMGCDYFPYHARGGFLGGFYPGSILYFLVWTLVIFLVGYVIFRIFRSTTASHLRSHEDRNDSLTILKMRFAQGKITRDEYQKMKQVLSAH